MSTTKNAGDPVTVADSEGVRTITLNRPEVLNAIDELLARALGEALRAAKHDAAVRCLVLTGAGRGFCSGQDLAEVTDSARRGTPISLSRRIREHYNPVIALLRTIEKPVIASVNGVAAGAGCSLALACDFRLAAASAVFIESFINVGLIPDCGATLMLPRIVGISRAIELAFTGRRVKAEEALEIGLINRLVSDADLPAATTELAQKLAGMPTRAIGLTKRAINAGWGAALEAQLEYEAELQGIAEQTRDYHEGVAAFIDRRNAVFRGE
ncbi:MAG: enoyl-CoA hydratase-related protein [Phycisphaerae bacterium]